MTESEKSPPHEATKSVGNLSEGIHKNTEVIAQETIHLLEERLIVETKRYKIGEVVVRKVVETRMIEVPVRREKLIVEQLYPEYKQLAEIDIDEEEKTKSEAIKPESLNGKSITSEFGSIHTAIQYLEAIAPQHQGENIKIVIMKS
jgi:Domain of unknown function (DUF2382)